MFAPRLSPRVRAPYCRRTLALLLVLMLFAVCLPSGSAPFSTASAQSSTPIITAIAAGFAHTCALTNGGGVKCWGANNYGGQLGDGTTIDRHTPVDVVGLGNNVTEIAAGHVHTCALTSSGGLKCWGGNGVWQLGDGTTTDRTTPVDVVGLSSGVTTIAVGGWHTCALTSGGGVKCWGANNYGQLGDGTTSDRSTPVDVIGMSSGVTAITASEDHTCALTSGGGVKCWGWNVVGQLGDGTTSDRTMPVNVIGLSSGVIANEAGYARTCALTNGGGVKCWGGNSGGNLGDGTTIDRHTPVDVVGLSSGVIASEAGFGHTCVLTSAGGIKCWGWNEGGQLGDGTTTDRWTPVDVVWSGNTATYTVSGRVTDSNILPIPGVTITDGAGHTTVSDSNGFYTLSGLAAGTYTITPSKQGYTFSPISLIVQVSADVTGQDFTATVDTTAVTPLIFVPGIMGSKLRVVENGTPGAEVWPSGPLVDQGKLSLDPAYLAQHQNLKIEATDVIRDVVVGGVKLVDIYKPLLTMLTTDGGYLEYSEDTKPYRRTTAGCPAENWAGPKPTLFVFPYDWRLDNTENARKLADYIGCIRQFHPGSKVDIVTHSMGGLVARSYMLQYPGNVNKLITIAAPWLGAPKAIQVLETGQYLDLTTKAFSGMPDYELKRLVRYFPGAHQLLPSWAYFDLGGQPFGEAGWDINDDKRQTTYYGSDDFLWLLNYRYYPAKPGSNNLTFHSAPGQDDWRNDTRGVTYYHFYGIGQREDTVDRVAAVSKTRCVVLNKWVCMPPEQTMNIVKLTRGDGTVPARSAARMSDPFLPPLLDLGLNAPGATRVPIYENTLQHSASVGHTELVKHPDVLAGILQALGAPTARIQLMAATTEVLPPTEVAYYLRVIGPLSVTLSNAVGQTANTLSGTLTTPIPDVTYHGLNDNAHLFVLPMSEPITMTLQSNGEPLEIELTAGTSITPTQAIRYQDLSLPAGSIAMIAITGQGVQPLQADTNGDGVFETTNVPTVNVSGPAAADTEPPMLTVAQSGPLNAMTVTLTATDSGSGVKAVRYSLDGTTYQPYTGPFQVNVLRTPTLYAFADDNVANRSSLLISPLIRSIYVPLVVR